jgi:hypothetical protein
MWQTSTAFWWSFARLWLERIYAVYAILLIAIYAYFIRALGLFRIYFMPLTPAPTSSLRRPLSRMRQALAAGLLTCFPSNCFENEGDKPCSVMWF